jgi:hypothetical protein
MHLDGEHLARVEELKQQWKTKETLRQPSHQLVLKLLHYRTDRLPFERSIGD